MTKPTCKCSRAERVRTAAVVMRGPLRRPSRGPGGSAMSQLRFWLPLAALSKVTLPPPAGLLGTWGGSWGGGAGRAVRATCGDAANAAAGGPFPSPAHPTGTVYARGTGYLGTGDSRGCAFKAKVQWAGGQGCLLPWLQSPLWGGQGSVAGSLPHLGSQAGLVNWDSPPEWL